MNHMGYHSPVMLEEAVTGLNIKNGGVYVDVTFEEVDIVKKFYVN